MGSDESDKKFDGTMVDLGEDLLEATRAIPKKIQPTPGKPKASTPPPPDAGGYNIQDEIQRGEILFAEKIFEDAKKVFRKVLRKDPNNAIARKYLDDIQKQEIQDLLGGEAPRKRLGVRDADEDDNPKVVLARLEKDLRISIEKAEIKPVPDLFPKQEDYDRYRVSVLETAADLPVRNRIDVGVAHLEMGLFDISQAIFEGVVRYDEYKISGMYLLGVALIYGGNAIEATIRLEPLCRDLTLGEGPKTDYLYLMGLAFERLNDTRKAREFYRRVFMLNPRYRDVPEKLK